jgi:hypothetical protein
MSASATHDFFIPKGHTSYRNARFTTSLPLSLLQTFSPGPGLEPVALIYPDVWTPTRTTSRITLTMKMDVKKTQRLALVGDSTRRKTKGQSLRRTGVTPIPLIYERCVCLACFRWRFLAFYSLKTFLSICRLAPLFRLSPSFCSLVGDDHFIVGSVPRECLNFGSSSALSSWFDVHFFFKRRPLSPCKE